MPVTSRIPAEARANSAGMQHRAPIQRPPLPLLMLQQLAGNRAINNMLLSGRYFRNGSALSRSPSAAQLMALLSKPKLAAETGRFIALNALFGAPDFIPQSEAGFSTLMLAEDTERAFDINRHQRLLGRMAERFWINADVLKLVHGNRDELPVTFFAKLEAGIRSDEGANEWGNLVSGQPFMELIKPVLDGVKHQLDWVRRNFEPSTMGELQQSMRRESRRPQARASRSRTSRQGRQIDWNALGLRGDALLLRDERQAEAAGIAAREYGHFRKDQANAARGFKWEEDRIMALEAQPEI